MTVSLVVALSENRVIGIENRLPWNLPDDMKYFRKLTEGKPVIMGLKTFESIGHPLSNRTNIVLAQDKVTGIPGCTVAHSIDEVLKLTKDNEEVMVIGGASVYKQFLEQELIDRMYLTIIHDNVEGDAYFPEFNLADWNEVDHIHHTKDDQHSYDFSFLTLERKKNDL